MAYRLLLSVAVVLLCYAGQERDVVALNPAFQAPLTSLVIGHFTPPLLGGKPINFTDPLQRAELIRKVLEDFLPNDPRKGPPSAACLTDIRVWIEDLLHGQGYALQMLDAFGKIPAQISSGHILWFGSYDNCLAVRRPVRLHSNLTQEVATVQAANYCLVRIVIPGVNLPTNPAMGLCLPSSCTANDTAAFLASIIRIIGIVDQRNITTGEDTLCKDTIPPQEGTTAILAIIGTFVGMCVIATFSHLVARVFIFRGLWNVEKLSTPRPVVPKKSTMEELVVPVPRVQMDETEIKRFYAETAFDGTNVEEPNSNGVLGKSPVQRKVDYVPFYMKVALCFSVVHNTNKLLAPSTEGHMDFLHGIRVMSMWWIMLGHIYQLGQSFFDNQLELLEDLKGFGQQLVLNANFAVDTFFLLSGLVLTYGLLKEVDRAKNNIPLFFIYVRRIWRLTPLYMVILMVYMFIVPYIADGPYPMVVRQQGSPTEHCKTYWWTTLAYVNNFVPANKNHVCMAWTWFLSANMQLFFITPPLVLLIVRLPRFSLALLGLIICGCAATVCALVTLYGIPLTATQLQAPLAASLPYDASVEYYYDKPYTGAINYMIGVILAVVIVKLKPAAPDRQWNLAVFLLGWAVSLVLAYGVLFGLYHGGLENALDMDMAERTVHALLARPAWGLVVAWVIYACHYGYGFAVKSFLSLPFWVPLSRLTYGAFLVHFLILQMYYTNLRVMLHYTAYQIISIFFSQVVAVYLVAFLAALFIEMPLLRLEQLVMYGRI